jgi:hypothetical protein
MQAYDDDADECEWWPEMGCVWDGDEGEEAGDCDFVFTGCEGLSQEVCINTASSSGLDPRIL